MTSMPPTTSTGATGKPTWPEVAMKLVSDVPVILLIVLVALLAWKGQAETRDLVMTGALSLLSRSWPKAIQVGAATAASALAALVLTGCAAAQAPTPAQQIEVGEFGAELSACVVQSNTRAEYVVCRNKVELRWAATWADSGVK